jgi:cobalt-zinc-cadmium efflux system outer membrane protein
MKYIFLLALFFGVKDVCSQDQLTLEQSEELFIKNNLLALAEQFNIEASKAALIQAKIWDLPNLTGEINLINPSEHRYFDAGQNGQKGVAIDQLIYLGGKKRNEINFAKSNVEIAELQYEQLLRSLKFQLHESFYSIYFNTYKADRISIQSTHIDELINAYSTQVEKGNIPLKDLVRLQSLSLSFKNEIIRIQKDIFSEQEKMKILLNSEKDILPIVEEDYLNYLLNRKLVLQNNQIQEITLSKNSDYLSCLKIIESTELMLKWQKSLNVPDLKLGVAYDQRGGAFQNQINLVFGIPIPLWKKNNGNVKIAEAKISESKLLKDEVELELKSKIYAVVKSFNYEQDQYIKMNNNLRNFEIVNDGIFQNFQKRNISLIEFTDFMESYNQSILLINDIKNNLMITGERLNYLANDKIF